MVSPKKYKKNEKRGSSIPEWPTFFHFFFIFYAISIKIGHPVENDVRILQVPLVLKSDQNCDLQTAARCLRYRVGHGRSKVEGASRESPQNLEFLFNIDEHLTSCVRMDVLHYEESLKLISFFLRAWFKFVRFFLITRYKKKRHNQYQSNKIGIPSSQPKHSISGSANRSGRTCSPNRPTVRRFGEPLKSRFAGEHVRRTLGSLHPYTRAKS